MSVKRIVKFLASPKIFFYLLFYLTAILVVGTITQKYFGIYGAQERYFSAWILMCMDAVPVPGGRLALLVMTVNLVSKLVFASRWHLKSLGVNIAHVGTFLLMFGAFLTAYYSKEGSLFILEGGSSQYYIDNELMALSLIDTSDSKVDRVYEFSGPYIEKGAVIRHEKFTGTLRVIDYHVNAELALGANKAPGNWRGMAARHVLVPKAKEKNPEDNRAAMVIEVSGTDGPSDGLYFVAQVEGPATGFQVGDKTYKMQIGPRVYPLPNNMRFELNDFVAEYYPGTNKPRHFASHLTLYEAGTKRQALIQMNEPLRLHGHTFYQSSFQNNNGQEATILSVVENHGRLFPYISSIVICIGIGLHLLLHYPAFLRGMVEKIERKATLVLLCALSCCFMPKAIAADMDFAEAVDDMVVHKGGRYKPFDTFARATLLGVYQKQRFNGKDATDWLWRALCNKQIAMQAEIFTIRTPAVVEAIGMQAQKSNRYKMDDLLDALTEHEALIQALGKRASEDNAFIDETEKQLLQLYQVSSNYLPLIHSLSCFWPDIQVDDPEIAKAFDIEPGTACSYYFFIQRRDALRAVLLPAAKAKEADPNFDDSAIRAWWGQLSKRIETEAAANLPIIPPLNDDPDAEWRSPWTVLEEGSLQEREQELMQYLDEAVQAFVRDDMQQFQTSIAAFKSAVGHRGKIDLEVSYNKADYFYKSLYFYIAAFLCLMVFWLSGKRWSYWTSFGLLVIGALMHMSGVLMRIIIMERPPISTLYETTIAAGLFAVCVCIPIELWLRNTWALMAACVIASVLQFIGFSYAAEGDTKVMLEAVLNSNFWLATHVTTIIIGYSVSLVAGILGHVLLVRYALPHTDKQADADLLKATRGVALVALFFTTLGTILGGIWADQSWGRFWGWDPKENGALLIVLWLLIAIHGFISGELKKIGFAAMLSLVNICVAIAWFGVNLLSVGLHSYGFSNKTAVALYSFCGAELVFVVVCGLTATYLNRRRQQVSAA